MVMMMGVAGGDLIEVAIRPVTGGVLHLDSAMRDSVMMLQKMLDTPQ